MVWDEPDCFLLRFRDSLLILSVVLKFTNPDSSPQTTRNGHSFGILGCAVTHLQHFTFQHTDNDKPTGPDGLEFKGLGLRRQSSGTALAKIECLQQISDIHVKNCQQAPEFLSKVPMWVVL